MLKEQWQNRKRDHEINIKIWKAEISLWDKKVGNFMYIVILNLNLKVQNSLEPRLNATMS